MKTLFVFLFSFLLVLSCTQKITTVPQTIQNRLKSLYPKAEEVKWEKENPNFEANFKVNDAEMSVIFDIKGNVLETETEMEEEDLPAAVKAGLARDFAGYDIEEAAKIVKNGNVTYEAQVEKGETGLDAIYSADGNLIKKVTKKENDEESEKSSNEKDEENEH
ncbi:MAG: hypothetical protein GXO77_01080 [Calditrichaeota bacterium]|nr:hypothetical protein [Calditrichota bacterium]